MIVAAFLGSVAVVLPSGLYSTQARSALTVVLWWVVALGLALGAFPRSPVPSPAAIAGAFLVGLTGFTLLSVGWASDNGGAVDEAMRAAAYAGIFALVVVASPAGSGGAWLRGLAAALALVSVLSLGSRMVPSLFPEQSLFSSLPETRGRLSYPLAYWNGLGALLALGSILLLALSAAARSRGGRAAAAAALALPTFAIFLTSSRGALVALGVGLIVLFVLCPDRIRMLGGAVVGGAGTGALALLANRNDLFIDGLTRAAGYETQGVQMLVLTCVVVGAAFTLRLVLDPYLDRVRVSSGVRFGAALGLATFVVLAVVNVEPLERWEELKAPPDTLAQTQSQGLVTSRLSSAEGSGRYQFWQAGWAAFKTEPLRGIGAAGYEPWWAQNGQLDYFVRNAHSLVVETLAELGLIGLFLLLGFLGTALVAGARRLHAPGVDRATTATALAVLGAGLMAALLEWTWEIPGAFFPILVMAALLTGPALGAGVPWSRGAVVGTRVALIALGCAGIAIGAISLAGDVKIRDSRAAVSEGDLRGAAREARRARSIQPWAAQPRLQLALVEERRGDLPTAARQIEEAIERSPEDWRIWFVAVRLRSRSGDRKGAVAALRRTRALAPDSPALGALLNPN